MEKVAQDFYDHYYSVDPELNFIEVQGFLASRLVMYPECRGPAAQEEETP